MCPANERQRYNVTLSLFGWVHTQNNPWRFEHIFVVLCFAVIFYRFLTDSCAGDAFLPHILQGCFTDGPSYDKPQTPSPKPQLCQTCQGWLVAYQSKLSTLIFLIACDVSFTEFGLACGELRMFEILIAFILIYYLTNFKQFCLIIKTFNKYQ